MMWLRTNSPHHHIEQLWDEKGYARLASIQVFPDGSAGYWFQPQQLAKPARSLSEAKRLITLHFMEYSNE